MLGYELKGALHTLPVESAALRGNRLGDPDRRDVLVYTPPGYEESTQRFPVVMLLSAFGSGPWAMAAPDIWKASTVELFDQLVATGQCGPALLVLPDATTRLGGSQFLDSHFAGNYQTFLADEVLAAVDRAFRTVPEAAGRAIGGRSSGGFGALRMVMDRPGLFSAVASHAGDMAFELSLRPLLPRAAVAFHVAGGVEPFVARIAEQGPRTSADHDGLFLLASATAYAEREEGVHWPPFPFDPETGEIVESIWNAWRKHDPIERVTSSIESLRETTYLFLDAGNGDDYGLQFGARVFAKRAQMHGVGVDHEEFEGGHRGTSHRYGISLPRLVAALSGA
ncbi:MAG: alpha/beta hydrolase [Myxococcales bacterium]|nr:alpha/beta hydrolase [Myxococcales bacterium]